MSEDVRETPITPERVRELLAAATPGPWVAEYSGEQGNCVIPHDAQSTREAVCVTRLYHQAGDAELIAAAPDIAAAYLAKYEELDRLTRELDERSPQTKQGHKADCQDRRRVLDVLRLGRHPEVLAVTERIKAGQRVESPLYEAIVPLVARLARELAAERAKVA